MIKTKETTQKNFF